MQKTNNKRLLKKTLKVFGICLAALLLIVIGLLIWLRTSSGADFVAGQLSSALAKHGITLTTSQFSGPLPSRLLARDMVVADSAGPIFKAALVEVELAPLALTRGRLHIPLIKISEPELIRIPATGADQPEEPSGPFSLPVEIKLDELAVTGGRMHEGALASLGVDTPLLTLAAGGSGLVAKSQSHLDFKAMIADDQNREVLNALIKLTGGQAGQPDQLNLSISVDDQPGGLLSRILDDPLWAGLNLKLTGQGPMTGWNGQLTLSADNLVQITADLDFAGKSGHLGADLLDRPDWRASLKAKAAPGAGLTSALLGWLGQEVTLNLSGGLNADNLAADLSIRAAGEPAVSLDTRLTGTLSEAGGEFKLAAQILGLLSSDPQDGPAADPAVHITADLGLGESTQRIDNLTVAGTGFEFKANLNRHTDGSAIQGQMALNVVDDTPWFAAGLDLAGLESDYFSGALNLTGDFDWRGLQEPVSGSLILKGQNLKWSSAALSNLFGPSLSVKADLSGGGGRPIVADIKEADAGVFSLIGHASFLQAEPLGHSQVQADLKAALTDLSALLAGGSGPLEIVLHGSGQLDDLKGDIRLHSSEIVTPQGSYTDPSISLTLAGALPAGSGSQADLTGRLELTVDNSPGGPLALSTDLIFQQGDTGVQAAVSNLSGSLAGLDLNGDLKAALTDEMFSLTGGLTAEVSGWDKLAALSGRFISGSPAQLAITLNAPGQRQSVIADLWLPALKIGQDADQLLALNQTSLTLLADDLFDRLDLDLDLQLGDGLSGPFSWSAGTIKAVGRGGAGEFEVALDRAKLARSGGTAKDGLKMAGHFDLTSSAIDLKQLDFRLAGNGVKLNEPLQLSLKDNFKISPLSLAFLPAGQMNAEVDMTPGAMKIKADIKSLPYGILRSVGVEAPDGTLSSFTVDLAQGTTGMTGDFSLKTQVAAKELKNIKPSLELSGRLTGGSAPALALEGAIDGGPGWKSDGKFSAMVPLSPGADGGFPTPNMNAPVSGQLTFTGSIAPVWGLLGQPDRSLSGLLKVETELAGTLANPKPQGAVYLAGGRYTDSIVGLLVNDITLEAHSTAESALTAILAAKDQYGGGIALEAKVDDFNNPSLSAKGRLSRFNPLHRDDLSAFISGDLAAEGPLDRLSFSSDLAVDRGELDLKIIQATGSIPTLSLSTGSDQAVNRPTGQRLGLVINVPNQFFIRGYGLDSEWRGTLNVGGSTNRPSLVGSLSPVRGYFEIFSKEFQFSDGDISFNGGTNPSLNLELINNGPNITAILKIGGSANRPKLGLESRPPLPQEEVLSQVLFGKSASSISRFEALQLASALNELRNFGSEGGFNAVGFMRESLGLDVLRLGGTDNDREHRVSNSLSGSMGQELSGGQSGGSGGESDQISVEAGKYISDNIYVGVEHSPSGGSAVRMEVELKPNLSLEGRTSTESSRVGLGWKKDY